MSVTRFAPGILIANRKTNQDNSGNFIDSPNGMS